MTQFIHVSTACKRNTLQKICALVFIVLSLLSAVHLFGHGLNWTDQPLQWRICVYTLRGIDIYSLRDSSSLLADIGEIGAGFHAAPWGCLLQTVFYGGFLSYEVSRIYFVVANIVVLVVASLVLYIKSRKSLPELGGLTLLISLLSADFMMSLYLCNAGGMIAAFMLIAWLISDEHEYLSGILLGFAMIKPQDAAIVCLVFLMMRKFKPLIVAAAIDLSAWFAVSILTHKGMLELLQAFLFSPHRNEGKIFAGIFTLVFANPMAAMSASMIFGILFVYLLHRGLPAEMPSLFKIYPAFIAVTFWSYSTVNDYYVLIVPAALCAYLMMRTGKIFWLFSSVYCAYGIIIRSILRRAMSLPGGQLNIPLTIHEAGLIILGVIICLELRHIYSKVKS